MNQIQLLGTITRDIELRYTQSGTAIASFSMAYNEKRKGANGNYNDIAHFFDVVSFGKRAEAISQYFNKGSRILINGSLQQESWTTQEGQKRSKVAIKLNDFDFIDRRDNTNQNQAGQGQPSTYQGNYANSSYGNQPAQSQNAPQQQQQTPPQQPSEINISEDDIPF